MAGSVGKQNESRSRGQIVYLSHGGGPLPILGEKSHRAMVAFMEQLSSQLTRPDAILVISAHWEERMPTLLGAGSPKLFYDYYGFPEETYALTYPAPGSPDLAGRCADLLRKNGIEAQIDPERGFDHGLFIPLEMIYPGAEIPALQLSLVAGLDPADHIAIGNALRELLHANILVIGSGFSFHNMRAFSLQGIKTPDPDNDAFQDWLIETCTGEMRPSLRQQRLIDWESAPSARHCHPREEHLIPLHVCAGLADTPAKTIFDDYILGKRAVAFQWG